MNTKKTAPSYYPPSYEPVNAADRHKVPLNPTLIKPGDKLTAVDKAKKNTEAVNMDSRVKRAEAGATDAAVADRIKEAIAKSKELAAKQFDNEQKLREIAEQTYEEIVAHQVAVRFEKIPEQDAVVAKLVRKNTGDVLFQVPPEDTMVFQKMMRHMPGFAFDEKA